VLTRLLTLPLTAALLTATPPAARAAAAPMVGFAAPGAQNELALESRFDAALDAREMRDWLERLSAEPNHIGSPHDRANAQFLLERLRAWGWDAHLETFYVLYPTPRRVALELLAPRPFRAALVEPAIPGDRTSARTRGALPPYNVYGADGDVSGELVYVNYGMPDDYRELARRNVSVKGRIVIARYGGGWRGLKPKLAYEHGAIGCIIYSDPRDDGYFAADTYPAGAGRPAAGLQRGSVADMPIYSGDPLTPGVGATRDAPRLERSAARTLLKIPVLPISYQDARPLLEALGGARAPAAWRGALPFTYHLGPGPARVRLTVASDWAQREIYDVVATLAGREYPDQWVIRGNHHDAWVFGADDPLSGTVALMAEAKALGALAATGWRPRRTIVYASWDGEEAGLLGSTEWVESHAAELGAKAVAYINSDSNSHGILHAGIASLNLGFGNDQPSGVYHSVYDSFDHYVKVEDPSLAYGVALAEVAGHALLRLAEAELLPLHAQAVAAALARYVDDLDRATERMRQQTTEAHRLLDERVYELAASATDPVGPPARDSDVPYLSFAPLRNAVAALAASAKPFDAAWAAALADPARLAPAQLAAANAAAGAAEQALLGEAGLPGRPWYRHLIVAPGLYTGYGAKTLPAVREAIEERHFGEVAPMVDATATAIDGYRRALDAATAALR
jgi:N-acetylated-alpha-linked acidic dipeptidase